MDRKFTEKLDPVSAAVEKINLGLGKFKDAMKTEVGELKQTTGKLERTTELMSERVVQPEKDVTAIKSNPTGPDSETAQRLRTLEEKFAKLLVQSKTQVVVVGGQPWRGFQIRSEQRLGPQLPSD